MKGIGAIILALIIAWIVWGLIRFLFLLAISILIKIALLAIFCYLVYYVFKLLTGREKAL